MWDAVPFLYYDINTKKNNFRNILQWPDNLDLRDMINSHVFLPATYWRWKDDNLLKWNHILITQDILNYVWDVINIHIR